MSSRMRTELELIVEQAQNWLVRLPAAPLEERLQFFTWLKESPLHVREFLAAVAWQDELRHPDLHHHVKALVMLARNGALWSTDDTRKL